MTKDEALRLALEALEYFSDTSPNMASKAHAEDAITAIKAALEVKDEPWTPDDTAYRPNCLPQDFIKHEVELPEDWSEWVCPNPDEYFMKCCDCGLVHEVQYRVARYGEGDYCELVNDKDVQAQFRMRRRTTLQQEKNDEKPWVCECGAGSYSACKCVFKAALKAKDEPVAWRWGVPKLKHGTFEWRYSVNKTRPDAIPLYTAPQKQPPVIDKSVARRIATQLGWEPKRKSLREEMVKQMKLSCDSMEMRGAFADGWLSAEAAHGIKGEA